jgi:hypothetical protein
MQSTTEFHHSSFMLKTGHISNQYVPGISLPWSDGIVAYLLYLMRVRDWLALSSRVLITVLEVVDVIAIKFQCCYLQDWLHHWDPLVNAK